MNSTVKRFVKIVAGATLMACGLGVCLDLVTANVAVEYFSVHHPRIVDTQNPWILGIVWGFAASWWFGAIAGTVVATINELRAQPLAPKRILKWVAVSCVVLWLVMIALLTSVYLVASSIPLTERRPSFDYDRRIMAVAVAHMYEYLLGAIAMLAIVIKTWWVRP